jgi:putative FmdB family regulatory protein
MPIYEYRCESCGRRVSILWRSISQVGEPQCEHCGSDRLTRRISQVAVLKSEESRLEELADPSSLAGLDEDDPKSIARWMRKMGGGLGEELGGEFDEVVDRLESGESPEEIDQTLGDGEEGFS